jgi:NAD(P)-dependent dehydrogenase (short-subunit alcohol dehydrogenase family)
MSNYLRGKSILITGASSGIGLYLAEKLSLCGAYVTGTYRGDRPKFHAFIDFKEWDIREDIPTSLSNRQWHAIINCAGVNYLEWIPDLDMDKVSEVLDVNVKGSINLLRYASMYKCTKNVILISSVASSQPMRCSIAYNASKAAVDMVVKQSARELGTSMNVVGVRPGFIEGTHMSEYAKKRCFELRGQDPNTFDQYQQQYIPKQRYPKMEELYKTIEWLLTEAPLEALSGTHITVSCGQG